MGLIRTAVHRMKGAGLPPEEEIEIFGSEGEEIACRMLYENFDCVIRNVIVPHKDLFLEKDFMVISDGVPFILEIKNWKGEIGAEPDGDFYQLKDNGVRKTLKSPVGTTNQFIRCMKEFYEIERNVRGMVVFVEPDCRLKLPPDSEGIALLTLKQMIPFIKQKTRAESKCREYIDPDRILRCTRFYDDNAEFCKGILADSYLDCTDPEGRNVRIDTTLLRFITVEKQPLHFRDKLYVTFSNGATGVFYNRDAILTVGCLDGSTMNLALNRVRYIAF